MEVAKSTTGPAAGISGFKPIKTEWSEFSREWGTEMKVKAAFTAPFKVRPEAKTEGRKIGKEEAILRLTVEGQDLADIQATVVCANAGKCLKCKHAIVYSQEKDELLICALSGERIDSLVALSALVTVLETPEAAQAYADEIKRRQEEGQKKKEADE